MSIYSHLITTTRHWHWPLAAVTLCYLLALGLTRLLFGEGPDLRAIPADWALHLAVALPLWVAFRSRWGFALVLGLGTVLLHLAHAAKTATLGGPVSPDDIYALQAFLLVSGPWVQGTVATGAVVALAAVVLGIGWRSGRSLAATGLLAAAVGAVVAAPGPLVAWLDRHFGHVEWNMAGNYHRRGPAIHTLQEVARALAERQPVPTAHEVQEALPAKFMHAAYNSPTPPRNVHMIVLESFWDAGLLTAALDQDPLPRDFRDLWAAAGFSHAMSPVFGGYTANAEFEALCGFPVAEPSVRFERKVTRQVPCLPAVLGQSGYVSVASHPNIPAFWNRHNVYQRIGFDVFWAGNDFVYDQMNGEFLDDRSLYRQVLAKIDPLLATGQPVFNYVLTFFGHRDYPLGEERPVLFDSHSQVPQVARYASTVYYKARELMDFLAALRERDPDSLVVVFGDHLPVLGERFAAYAESGLLAPELGSFTPDMYATYSSTPLLVLDGRNGPVPVGRLPMYRLPALLLALLGNDAPTIFDYTAPPAGMQVRPLPGLRLDLVGEHIGVCRGEEEPEVCGASAEWLRRVDTLAADLFTGAQYALPAAPLPPGEREPQPVVEAEPPRAPEPGMEV